jgi:HSP20 family molecular chaperone IbpA
MFELLQEMSRLQNTPTTDKSSVIRLSHNAVYQSKDDVQLEIAYSVLGYGQEDVTVEANNNILKVKAKKEDVESIQSKLIKEIDDTITINKDYDLEKAECLIKNGILLIVIPKKEDTLAKKLPIKLLK